MDDGKIGTDHACSFHEKTFLYIPKRFYVLWWRPPWISEHYKIHALCKEPPMDHLHHN